MPNLGGIVALAALQGRDVTKTAHKLHRQFGHPTAVKLVKLIKDAGVKDSRLEQAVHRVTGDCDICTRFGKVRPRPVVSLPMASRFNEAIALDLKVWGAKYFFVIIDLATRYCTATVISDKRAATIIKALFQSWFVIFGAPEKILSDNGCEFNNEEMRALGEAFNVKIMATAAESPWSNGVCERLNAVVGNMVRKILADTKCGLEVALAWAVSARNALTNFSGFSPNQLVFGHNPGLPKVYDNDPPALEGIGAGASDIVRVNLNALHLARQEFMRCESDERLARALRHNIRASDLDYVQNGDEVFYKRHGSYEWHGPGTVIGRDGKQVLVRHGGVYVRAHECRLARAPTQSGEVGDDGLQADVQHNSKSVEQVNPEEYKHVEESDSDDGNNEPETEADDLVCETAGVTPQQGPSRLAAGQRIQGIRSDSGELVSGQVVSRAGKATGKYRDCYNFRWDSDGSTSWADLNRDFNSWKIVNEDTEVLILFNSGEVMCAKELELQNWKDNEVYEEVEDVGQETLSVRWVVTEKLKAGQKVVKARLVARGFEEDTSGFRKDSPTCSRESIRLALALASAMGWACHSLDVKAAYLQGNEIGREVYLRPPPEFADGRIWKLRKTVYGLCDAARHWYLRVKDQLLALGAQVCTLDPALFSWKFNGRIEGVICIYVDDFLWAGTPEFKGKVIDCLRRVFLIGSFEAKAFKYVGLNIASYKDGSFTLDQLVYASTLTPMTVSRQRSNVKTGEVSESERSEYRARVGQLNWIANHTRPDVAFDVCERSAACNRATVADILQLNKVISRVKTDNVLLHIPRLPRLESCYLECFSDASFANLMDGGSQGGFVIFLRGGDVRCPIYWQSKRIRRVVKSTLSAEALALLDCLETAVYLAKILQEISGCGNFEIRAFVDNKSLVDNLSSGGNVEDKRLRIDIAVLRGMLESGEIAEVAWVDASGQLADCLTKKGASPEQLRAAISKMAQ